MKRALWAAALFAAAAAPAQARADALESAMAHELGRAMTQLKEEGYPPAYYLSLTAVDLDFWEQRCQMGAPAFTGQYKQRLVTPDLRVGDYALDNHPVSNPAGYHGRPASYEEDEFALRYGLWRQLDAAYKGGAADFLRKQALRVSRGKTDYDTDDLTREQPRQRRLERGAAPGWDTAALGRLCAQGGRELRRTPGLLSAETVVRLRRQWSRVRDSEGSAVDFGRDVAEIEIEAVDRSSDGMKLSAARRFAATTPEALPGPEAIAAAAGDMLEGLRALKAAASTSPFNAPALLDPSVSAVAVLSIALRLSGEEQRNPSGAQTFRGKMGKAVLPSEFSLVDDPTRREFAGKPLAGHYEFDDQGVPPQPVTLVDRGVLKGLLLSRYPAAGFTRSNGHGRGFPGYAPEGMPGALFLTASRSYTDRQLLDMLRADCRKRGKPYGIWVRKLRNFSQQQGTGGHASIRLMGELVYLVDAKTGALTLVRDLDLVGTPLVFLNNIRAAGRDAKAHDLVYGAPVSVVVPSLLLADAELQRAETRPEKPPILPPPGPAVAAPAAAPADASAVEIRRYVVRGAGRLLPRFVVDGVADSRQHLEGLDAYLEFKLAAPTASERDATARRLDAAVSRWAAGRPVETSTLPASDWPR